MGSALHQMTTDLQDAVIQTDPVCLKLSNIISLCLIGSAGWLLFATPGQWIFVWRVVGAELMAAR